MYSKGINKADVYNRLFELLSKSVEKKPCVFLSHKKEDKPACKKIAEYLADAGIDYYLDEEDEDLQRAASVSDPIKITEKMQKLTKELEIYTALANFRRFTVLKGNNNEDVDSDEVIGNVEIDREGGFSSIKIPIEYIDNIIQAGYVKERAKDKGNELKKEIFELMKEL